MISNNADLNQKLALYRSFGHISDDYFSVGINGKNSEFHAAMGLAVLPKIQELITERKLVFEIYKATLPASLQKPPYDLAEFEYNYSYYPVIFESEKSMLAVKEELANNQVNARRYFYPSLNMVPQVTGVRQACPVSEDISTRVLCLPLYHGLEESDISRISSIIKNALS